MVLLSFHFTKTSKKFTHALTGLADGVKFWSASRRQLSREMDGRWFQPAGVRFIVVCFADGGSLGVSDEFLLRLYADKPDALEITYVISHQTIDGWIVLIQKQFDNLWNIIIHIAHVMMFRSALFLTTKQNRYTYIASMRFCYGFNIILLFHLPIAPSNSLARRLTTIITSFQAIGHRSRNGQFQRRSWRNKSTDDSSGWYYQSSDMPLRWSYGQI